MKFYTGIHVPSIANAVSSAFISVNVLRSKNRKSFFNVGDWIMDSGAFTELSKYGHYRFSVSEYAEWINKFSSCGNLEFAVAQDYMCEPFILAKTGMTVSEHQRLTIERYDELLPLTSVKIMPVLQGYQPSEYVEHIRMYGDRLTHGMRVGVGSVCKRNVNPQSIVEVLESIKQERPDLQLHGFGLKTTALKNAYISSMLFSADSMAWSFSARKSHNNPNGSKKASVFAAKIASEQGTKPHQLKYKVLIRDRNKQAVYEAFV